MQIISTAVGSANLGADNFLVEALRRYKEGTLGERAFLDIVGTKYNTT